MSTERLHAFRFVVMHTGNLCQIPVLVLIKASDEVKALSEKFWPTWRTCAMTSWIIARRHKSYLHRKQ